MNLEVSMYVVGKGKFSIYYKLVYIKKKLLIDILVDMIRCSKFFKHFSN